MAKRDWLREGVVSLGEADQNVRAGAAILLDGGDYSRSCFIHNVEGGFGGTAKSTEAG